MWIVCQADDSHVMSSIIFSRSFTCNVKHYFLWKNTKNMLWKCHLPVVIGALRVNTQSRRMKKICFLTFAARADQASNLHSPIRLQMGPQVFHRLLAYQTYGQAKPYLYIFSLSLIAHPNYFLCPLAAQKLSFFLHLTCILHLGCLWTGLKNAVTSFCILRTSDSTFPKTSLLTRNTDITWIPKVLFSQWAKPALDKFLPLDFTAFRLLQPSSGQKIKREGTSPSQPGRWCKTSTQRKHRFDTDHDLLSCCSRVGVIKCIIIESRPKGRGENGLTWEKEPNWGVKEINEFQWRKEQIKGCHPLNTCPKHDTDPCSTNAQVSRIPKNCELLISSFTSPNCCMFFFFFFHVSWTNIKNNSKLLKKQNKKSIAICKHTHVFHCLNNDVWITRTTGMWDTH